MTIKILTVIGARPQFVKSAVVSRELQARKGLEEYLIHTGQHYDHNMSGVFFEDMGIPEPYMNLEVKGGAHGAATGEMLEKLEGVMLELRPNLVLVYGDTNSTLAGALCASKLHLPIAHVEAGLRSYNKKMPEEINRLLTDHVADLLFCPTQTAVDCLRSEGIIDDKKVFHVGDVMYDAALYYSEGCSPVKMDGGFVLSTIHRAENTDNLNSLRGILEGLSKIPRTVVLPLHPRTKSILHENSIVVSDNIKIIDPVPYSEMVSYLKGCEMVITDSGGLQKEAYFFGKPCITTREETEWRELVDQKANLLVGADPVRLIAAYEEYEREFVLPSILEYGNGDSAKLICDHIANYFA